MNFIRYYLGRKSPKEKIVKNKNDGLAGVKKLLVGIDAKLRETHMAVIAVKHGNRDGATQEVLKNDLGFLMQLAGAPLFEIPKFPGIELLEALQKKMEASEFRTTISVMQKSIANQANDQPSEAEFSVAQSFLCELQSVYIKKILALAEPAYQ